ncbi:hypothetical protein [Chlorogloea sp. CCALA 695]|uniref:hypothetical protein n=1 Tax=Chlorogloea sp. CCALA 695 TaxID=2107693 RepID=UPI0011B1E4EB|nr:hypothetical protein [Chlorogloea sp. CCALA 695]
MTQLRAASFRMNYSPEKCLVILPSLRDSATRLAYWGYETLDLTDCFYSFLKVIVRSLRWIQFIRQNPILMPLSLEKMRRDTYLWRGKAFVFTPFPRNGMLF